MKLKCPICSKDVNYEKGKPLPRFFPFCSHRCKMVDLGKWINEEYKVSVLLPTAGDLTESDKRQIGMDMLQTGEVDAILEDEEDE